MKDWYFKRRLGDLPRDAARRFPDREGLVFAHQRFTFSAIESQVDSAARALLALGVGHGDHVALWLVNRPEWLFITFALARIGAVIVPVNARFRSVDLQYLLHQSDTRFLITHEVSGPVDYLSMVKEIVQLPESGDTIADQRFPELHRVVIVGAEVSIPGVTLWQRALADGEQIAVNTQHAREAAVDPDDPVLIMYTSGTTGFPKGVVHSHKILRNVEERAYRMAVTEADTVLNYLPLFHAFAFSEGALMSLVSGARQILTESFDAHHALDLVEREHVSLLHGFEAHMQALCDAQEQRPRQLASLRTGLFAAGTLGATPVLQRGARLLSPLRSLSAFGMTETWLGASVSALDDDETHRLERSGYPAPGYEFRVVDPLTEREQPRGVPGELRVRGYGLMLGYYKNAEATANAYDSEGWFRTGDMGEHHADGHIRFLGRYKDMLKVGGENVDPLEIEGYLLRLEGIAQVAIVGYPDARLAEVPVACVVLRQDSVLSEPQIIEHCRNKVASFKIPRHVLFIDALPMTPSGKVQKVELRTWVRAYLDGETQLP